MTGCVAINFEQKYSSDYWAIPNIDNNYPKYNTILNDNNLNNKLNYVKELTQSCQIPTFIGTPMIKLGLTCYDIAIAVNEINNFKNCEAADNWLCGKLKSIISILQKVENFLKKNSV